VHAAAMTQVDECELQQDKCFAVNVLGTANIIAAAEKFQQPFHPIYPPILYFSGEKAATWRKTNDGPSTVWPH